MFSLCQLVAAPALGDLSDRYGRRPVLIFSLAGTVVSFVMLALAQAITMLFVARIVDGLSGGNISTARAYVADVTEPKDRARAYGLIGAAFGLGFIFGPALSGVLAKVSYTAPIWAAAAMTLVATAMAWLWLPETVHRAARRHGHAVPQSRRDDAAARTAARARRSISSTGSRSRFSRRRSRCSSRAGSDSTRRRPAISSPAFGVLGAVVQGGVHPPDRPAAGRQADVHRSAWCSRRSDWSPRRWRTRSRCSRSRSCRWRSGSASAIRRCRASSAAPAGDDEQGRVQGAASAMESLGPHAGPVWGNASLQRFGEGMPYLSAAVCLALTLVLSLTYTVTDSETALLGCIP